VFLSLPSVVANRRNSGIIEKVLKNREAYEQTPGSQYKGMYFLILFYTFILIQNVLGLRQFGGSAFIAAVVCGTLVYITIGLIKRQSASWFIAITFHIAYQAMITIPYWPCAMSM